MDFFFIIDFISLSLLYLEGKKPRLPCELNERGKMVVV